MRHLAALGLVAGLLAVTAPVASASTGTVVAWGDGGNGQTSIPSGLANVKAISAGRFHSLALKADGKVVAWGEDFGGLPPCLRVSRT
jgi:hypothetical protein